MSDEASSMPEGDAMKRAITVLSDALRYEFDMLDAVALHMQKEEFKHLGNNETECLIRNAIVESFWTHARNLLEFFNQTQNRQDLTASSASAKDFTCNFNPSSEIKALWADGSLKTKINEMISHVGFCRRTELYKKLDINEMERVKSVIDKEVQEFELRLREMRERLGRSLCGPLTRRAALDGAACTRFPSLS
jgi:hypothetical protein